MLSDRLRKYAEQRDWASADLETAASIVEAAEDWQRGQKLAIEADRAQDRDKFDSAHKLIRHAEDEMFNDPALDTAAPSRTPGAQEQMNTPTFDRSDMELHLLRQREREAGEAGAEVDLELAKKHTDAASFITALGSKLSALSAEVARLTAERDEARAALNEHGLFKCGYPRGDAKHG